MGSSLLVILALASVDFEIELSFWRAELENLTSFLVCDKGAVLFTSSALRLLLFVLVAGVVCSMLSGIFSHKK